MLTDFKNTIHKSAENMTSVEVFYYNLADTDIHEDNYITFYLINNSKNGSDTGNEYKNIQIQFNVFSNVNDNGDTVEIIADELINVYKEWQSKLSIPDSFQIINVNEDFIIPARYVDGKWQVSVQYTVHVLTNSK